MFGKIFLLATQLTLTVFGAIPAFAESAIFHSGPENVHGWCAGYAQSRSNRCAEQHCQNKGGSACRFVAGCGGPGAVAYAERPARGFAAACLGNERSARSAALIGCISATNALCWTNVTFTSGGRILDADSNRTFDRVWIAQNALQALSFLKEPADGSLEGATMVAVLKYQVAIGRFPNGIVDDALVRGLVDAVGGPRHLASMIKRHQLQSLESKLAGAKPARLSYAALEASPEQSPNQYFKSLTDDERRVALTKYIMARGAKCTVPSKAVSELTESIWAVVCEEATYNVIFNDSGSIITGGRQTIVK